MPSIRPRDNHNPPYKATHPPPTRHYSKGLAPGAIAAIVIVVLLVVALAAYVIYTKLRARRLGLPAPGWRSFIPFVSHNKRTIAGSGLEPTRPAGGILGRLKGGKGYSGRTTRGQRTAMMEASDWDDRIEEEEELGYRGAREREERERGRSRSRTPVGGRRQQDDGFGDVGVRGGRMSVESFRAGPNGGRRV